MILTKTHCSYICVYIYCILCLYCISLYNVYIVGMLKSCVVVLPVGQAARFRHQHSLVGSLEVHSTGECCQGFSRHTPDLQAEPSLPVWTWLWSGPVPDGQTGRHQDMRTGWLCLVLNRWTGRGGGLVYLHSDHPSWFETMRRFRKFSIQREQLRVWIIREASTLRDRQVGGQRDRQVGVKRSTERQIG